MESTQDKPTRKRRGRAIFAVVLALASMFSWWHWPRGDARFVGKWSTLDFEHPQTFHFRANGTGQHAFDRADPPVVRHFSWHTEQSTLVLQYHCLPDSLSDVWESPRFCCRRLLGDSESHQVSNVASDMFTMELDPPYCTYIPMMVPVKLARVSE
jgi:hypothetical protein